MSSRSHLQSRYLDLHTHARDNFLIPTRIYSPRNPGASITRSGLPIYVFYHNDGFIYGTLDSEYVAYTRIITATDIIIILISYRHALKHLFPAAYNDALDGSD